MRRSIRQFQFALIGFLFVVGACTKDEKPAEEVMLFRASGDIGHTITAFRNQLEAGLSRGPGPSVGHREINWDGIPDSLLAKELPTDFFNPVGPHVPVARQRGLVYATNGGSFQVSKDGFSEVNAQAASEFRSFSGDKMFANVGAGQWPATFQVPGTTTPATVKGFGIVFADVDLPNSTFIEYFNEERSLGKFFVPPHDASSSFSFIGIYFKKDKITSVKISHQGRLIEGKKDVTQGGTDDLVALDDFLYSEPVGK